MIPAISDLTKSKLERVLDRMDYGSRLKAELLMSTNADEWMPYAQPLVDAVNLFEEMNIGYALIGGIAAMYYGRGRFTENVDFLTSSIGVPPMERNIGETPMLLQYGMKVHLWKDERGDEIVARAIPATLAGRAIKIIEPHDLVAMKLRARRLKDDYDISQILLETPLDETRLKSMVSAEELAHFAAIKKRT